MTEAFSQLTNYVGRWIPYSIAGVGIAASITWYFLMSGSSIQLLPIKESPLFWIILTAGLTSAVFLIIVIGLYLWMVQNIKSLNEQNSKKELLTHNCAEETKLKIEKTQLQGQKLQAIGTLAGGIAHDFNNIIYAIIGYVEMAREDVAKDSPIYNNLGKVLEASHHGKELISRILTFSRKQHHQPFTVLSLQETIESALALLKPTIPSSVTIQVISPEKPCFIKGDLTQLQQAIVNIVNNAVDAMEGEGSITIKIQTFSKIDKSNYYKIEISDTGNGMNQATLERIFEPFFTTKEVGKGTGLGLSTVHTIITDHQGEITASSQLGHGTTFTLLLPEYKEK